MENVVSNYLRELSSYRFDEEDEDASITCVKTLLYCEQLMFNEVTWRGLLSPSLRRLVACAALWCVFRRLANTDSASARDFLKRIVFGNSGDAKLVDRIARSAWTFVDVRASLIDEYTINALADSVIKELSPLTQREFVAVNVLANAIDLAFASDKFRVDVKMPPRSRYFPFVSRNLSAVSADRLDANRSRSERLLDMLADVIVLKLSRAPPPSTRNDDDDDEEQQ